MHRCLFLLRRVMCVCLNDIGTVWTYACGWWLSYARKVLRNIYDIVVGYVLRDIFMLLWLYIFFFFFAFFSYICLATELLFTLTCYP